jgi:hypothetical protein
MMEHRYSPRVHGALDVAIVSKGRRLGCYRTRNLRFEGMFLETCPVDLQVNDLLTLHLTANGQSHGLGAVVVHRSDAGLGVMLLGASLGYSRLVLEAIEGGALRLPRASASKPTKAHVDRMLRVVEGWPRRERRHAQRAPAPWGESVTGWLPPPTQWRGAVQLPQDWADENQPKGIHITTVFFSCFCSARADKKRRFNPRQFTPSHKPLDNRAQLCY